jgi:hypothetical protein
MLLFIVLVQQLIYIPVAVSFPGATYLDERDPIDKATIIIFILRLFANLNTSYIN